MVAAGSPEGTHSMLRSAKSARCNCSWNGQVKPKQAKQTRKTPMVMLNMAPREKRCVASVKTTRNTTDAGHTAYTAEHTYSGCMLPCCCSLCFAARREAQTEASWFGHIGNPEDGVAQSHVQHSLVCCMCAALACPSNTKGRYALPLFPKTAPVKKGRTAVPPPLAVMTREFPRLRDKTCHSQDLYEIQPESSAVLLCTCPGWC